MSFKLVGIGEILWDLLPTGRQLGGAPANFAYHASALGGEVRIVSRVGNDELGQSALSQLRRLGLSTDCVEIDHQLATGTAGVAIADDGQPHFQIQQNVAWDALVGELNARDAIVQADAICFGTLAQRSPISRHAIRSMVASASHAALRILDVNLRSTYFSSALVESSLELANVLKLNDSELPQLARMFDLSGDVRSQIRELAERFELTLVAYTRGGQGSILYTSEHSSDHPGIKTRVVDTIGAGDSFTAAMATGWLAGWDLDRINQLANHVASYVCAQPGGTPPMPMPLDGFGTPPFLFQQAAVANST